MLAFAVALCGAWLAFTWSGVTVALSVFVLALLFVFDAAVCLGFDAE